MNAPPSPYCVLQKDNMRELIKEAVGPIAKFFDKNNKPEGWHCTQQGKRTIYIRWYGDRDQEDKELNRCMGVLSNRGYSVRIFSENAVIPKNHEQRRLQGRRRNRHFLQVQRRKK